MQTHVLYIPGLGDRYDFIRKFALKRWRKKGISVEFIPMRWQDPAESYESKLRRVRGAVQRAGESRIVLIGESAGGAVAIAETLGEGSKVTKCLTICGKNVGADRVSPRVFAKNPAFRDAIKRADSIVNHPGEGGASRIVVYRSFFDPVIAEADSVVDGARTRRLPAVGHLPSIFLVLFLFWPMILREAMR